ncbi:MAG: hypothetical protein JRN06_09020 [Nitrososphaerota archaeon]|nr:hypothetical protein [Nitrososphaerota archaeon]MDG7024556.1 hypothetical protein [Nitrososphaerota archaeon]
MASRSSAIFSAAVLVTLILGAGGASAQTAYALKVQTDQQSYFGTQPILISGSVTPAPGASTGVVFTIVNPSGTKLGYWNADVNGTTGDFSYSIVAGGSSAWVAGTYTVNATWGAYPPQVYAHSTFSWSPTATTTTTTTTTTETPTTTTTTTPSTTTTTAAPSTTTTPSSSGGGIPEFPFQAVSVGILVAVVVAGYLLAKRSSLAGRRLPSPR